MAFEIIASINTAGSIKEIADKLSNEVANGVNAKMPLKIVATINKEKTITEINNSLNSLNGISIKNIQIDGSSAVKNVKAQFKGATDDIVKEFNKLTSIPSNVIGTTKKELNSTIKNLLNQFATGNVEQSANAVNRLTEIIDKQSRIVVSDKSELENLRDILRSFGKIHIDETLYSDLKNITGSAKEANNVLKSVFGVGGYSTKQGKGVGDFSGLLGTNSQLQQYTADANGLLKIYENLKSLSQNFQNPISIFEYGGLEKSESAMREFLNNLLKLPNEIQNVTSANNSLKTSCGDLIKRINDENSVLRVTEEEFKKLQNITYNNPISGLYTDGKNYTFFNEFGQMKQVIIETNKEAEKLSQTSTNVKELTNSFANLQGMATQPIKPVIDKNGIIDADKTIQSVRERFKEFKNVSVDGAYINENGISQLKRIEVSLKNGNEEARTFKYSLSEINKLFNLDSSTYSDKGKESYFKKINAEVTKLTSKLDKLHAEYTDINAIKKIDNSENIDKLNRKQQETLNIINKLKTATSENMAVLKANAEKAISEYGTLAKSLQRAEYFATSLRPKDIETIQSIETEKLKQFEAQISNSKVPVKELKSDLKQLNNELAKPLTKEGLIEYLNNLDIAKAKFNALKEQYSNNEAKKYYDRLIESIKKVTKLEVERIKASPTDETKELDRQIKNLQQRIRDTEKQIEIKQLYNGELNKEVKLQDRIRENENKLANERNKNKKNSQAIKEQEQAVQKYNNSITQTIKSLTSLSNVAAFRNNPNNSGVYNLQSQIKSLINNYQTLKDKFQQPLTSDKFKSLESELNKLSAELNKTKSNASELLKTLRDNSLTANLKSRIENLKNQITNFQNLNPKAMQQGYSSQLQSLLTQLSSVANTNDFNVIRQKFAQIKSEINQLGLTGDTVLGKLKSKVQQFATWMGITMVTANVAREIRGMFTDILELDTALVDLKKTFTGTNAELKDFYYESNNIAKQLGVTTADVINSTSSWQRLGYSIKEATELANTTSIFKSISPEMTIDEAQTSMVSIIKAFDIQAEDALEEVASKINIIGNTYALSNLDVTTALSKSAAALKSANNSFEESIGLIVAGQEIMQDADTVGQGLKTVSARVRGLSEDFETVDDELVNIKGDIYELSGVSIMEDADTYKSTYQILKEISEVWDNLSDKKHSQISELLFGKHRLSLGLSILDNFKQAENAVETMKDSAGSAMKEMEVIYDSLDYKINAFKQTIVGIAQETITQDFLKSVVDNGTEMLQTFESAGNVIRPVFSLISGLISLVADLSKAFGGLDKIVAGLAISKSINGITKGIFGADRAKMIALIISMSA